MAACHRIEDVGIPTGAQYRHMSVEVVGTGPLRGSIDDGRVHTRHASLSSLGSTNLSHSEDDELDEVAPGEGRQRPLVS